MMICSPKSLCLYSIFAVGLAVAGCTKQQAKAVETEVIDLTGAACSFAGAIPGEPDLLKYACQVLDAAGNIIKSFELRVTTTQAEKLGLPAAPK